MSWKTVKNFLMLLLLGVNLLLAYFAYNYYSESHYTDSDTAKNAAAVLEKSGLYVSAELLGVKNDTVNMLYTSYDRESYICLAASMLFGKEADGIYMLPNGVRAETLEGDAALLGYDMSVDFTEAMKKDEIEAALKNASPMSDDVAAEFSDYVENKFSLYDGAVEKQDCTYYGDYAFVTVAQKENGLPIYSMECVFGFRGEKIVYARGKHFFEVPEGEENAQLLDRVNILFSEKERGMTGTVTDIKLCYSLYEEADRERVLFVPSYVLTYSDNTERTVNAVSKKLY